MRKDLLKSLYKRNYLNSLTLTGKVLDVISHWVKQINKATTRYHTSIRKAKDNKTKIKADNTKCQPGQSGIYFLLMEM